MCSSDLFPSHDIQAYNLIWNEWFRDENLQDSVVVDKDNGPDSPSVYVILKRGKRHDYFSSALPWPQKGDAVDLPLGTTAPVVHAGGYPTFTDGTNVEGLRYTASPSNVPNWTGTPLSGGQVYWANTALQADLTHATAATINSIREAFQIQRFLEKDARGGTRYIELIRSHFNVVSPDARLQRPEYLGGGSTPVNITPVAQTSSTDATTPQGNLAGFGTVSPYGHGFSKSFVKLVS